MQEYYILQQEELLILASLYDMNRIYGIEYKSGKNEKKVPYRIHEMTRTGIFALREEKLFVQEPYRTILHNMQNSFGIFTAKRYGREERYVWFYSSEKMVCMEESRVDGSAVRIGLLEKSELFEYLAESGFFPEECLEHELASLEDVREVKESLEQLPVCVRFQMLPTRASGNGESRECRLIRSRHNYWITGNVSSEEEIIIPYEKEKLCKVLLTMLEENA